jgi:hypothetical protein
LSAAPVFFPSLRNHLQRAVEVRARFGVGRDDIGAGSREGFEIGIDWRDHQVDVEGLLRVRAQLLDDGGTDGDVRNEMTVHHVDMDHVRAGRIDSPDFLTQRRKIGSQN